MRRLARHVWQAILGSIAASAACADSGGPPTIATDRPSVTDSAVVVPEGGFQMENGLLVANLNNGAVLDLPESAIRYGLAERTELRLSVPDYFYSLTSASASASGFGDAALGVKRQLGPLGGVDVSIVAFASIPTGARQISSHGYDPGLQVPWAHSIAANWTVAGQIAAYWPTVGGRRDFTSEATLLLDRTLSVRCDLFTELAVDSPQRGGTRQQLHAGTTYRLAANQQIDFHVAAGLSRAAPRNYLGVGYSFLLPTR